MLTHGQLKSHVLHEDRWVRAAVLDCFYNSWSRDQDLVELALTAHDRYFREGEFPNLGQIHRFRINEGSAEKILALLDATSSRLVTIQLNWCVSELPLEILRQQAGRLETHAKVDEEARALIRLRRELAGLSDEELWRKFVQFSGLAEMRPVPHLVEPRLVRALTDELAARAAPDGEAICAMLGTRALQGTWFAALLMRLAGAKGLREALPYLVDELARECDVRPSYEEEALVRIGDPAAVELIRERWPRFYYKAGAADVLGRMHTPESEEFLISIFDAEGIDEVRFAIAKSLCDLFSREGVELIRRVIREGNSYNFDKALEESLLPVIDLLGIDFPEAEPWRKAREEELARLPSGEQPSVEALRLHQKMQDALRGMDEAEKQAGKAWEALGGALPGSEEDQDG